MAVARSRRLNRPEYWPAFVDVLTNLLLVFIFLLSIFALVQFLLSREISGKPRLLSDVSDARPTRFGTWRCRYRQHRKARRNLRQLRRPAGVYLGCAVDHDHVPAPEVIAVVA